MRLLRQHCKTCDKHNHTPHRRDCRDRRAGNYHDSNHNNIQCFNKHDVVKLKPMLNAPGNTRIRRTNTAEHVTNTTTHLIAVVAVITVSVTTTIQTTTT